MDSRHIQFSIDKSRIDLLKLQELFNLTAFWAQNRNLEDLEIAIANSNPVITVWDSNTMIGFARATSDGVYRASIWDVIVHPEYQGCGLGRKLVETVITHPHLSKVERIYLMTSYQQNFYQRIGFEENKTTTMVLFNSVTDETLLTPTLIKEKLSV